MWPYPNIVAHRGGGILAPENTLAAMRCGLAHGLHAVEFDVMLSKDGIPVVMHDVELGRTVSGVGRVCDFTAKELVAMDAGSWFSPEFRGETIPLFEQVIVFCQQNHIWMNVEIKPDPSWESETGRAVAQMVRQHYVDVIQDDHQNQAKLPLLSSFSFDALMAAKLAVPDIPRAYLVEALPADWLQCLQKLDAIALHIDHQHLSLPIAKAVKQAGFGLFCYTVNDLARAQEIMAWGVDGFCTDQLGLASIYPHV